MEPDHVAVVIGGRTIDSRRESLDPAIQIGPYGESTGWALHTRIERAVYVLELGDHLGFGIPGYLYPIAPSVCCEANGDGAAPPIPVPVDGILAPASPPFTAPCHLYTSVCRVTRESPATTYLPTPTTSKR